MRIFAIVAAIAATMTITACTSVPIMNVDQAPVTTVTNRALTTAQVRSAIVQAGTSLGWQMRDEAPGMLVGTLQLRTHSAVVAIPYSTTSYSIQYRSSTNLDASGGMIHRNYNGWIQNLTRAINAQLSAQ
jgi:type IV pilus biogenesis protein CpaD/CtpE